MKFGAVESHDFFFLVTDGRGRIERIRAEDATAETLMHAVDTLR
jgi:hypothetical protein